MTEQRRRDPETVQKRALLDECFDMLEQVADEQESAALLMTTQALRRVHALFPEADEMRHRGTAEHQARLLIHNTIADVFNMALSLYPVEGEEGL